MGAAGGTRASIEADERDFHNAMVKIYDRARDELGYVATRFVQMVSERGGVEAARQLLRGGASEGLFTLSKHQRLDLSMEFHVLLPPFERLFTVDERETARSRLESLGFPVDAALIRWSQENPPDDSTD